MKDSRFFTLLGMALGFGGIYVMDQYLLIGAIMSCSGIYFWCVVGQKRKREEKGENERRKQEVLRD